MTRVLADEPCFHLVRCFYTIRKESLYFMKVEGVKSGDKSFIVLVYSNGGLDIFDTNPFSYLRFINLEVKALAEHQFNIVLERLEQATIVRSEARASRSPQLESKDKLIGIEFVAWDWISAFEYLFNNDGWPGFSLNSKTRGNILKVSSIVCFESNEVGSV